MAEWYSIVHEYPNFSNKSSVDGCLGYFHVFSIVNSAAMNIRVRVSFQIRVFIFSRYMPWSRIAKSYGNSIFSFLKNLHTVFHVNVNFCTHTLCQYKFVLNIHEAKCKHTVMGGSIAHCFSCGKPIPWWRFWTRRTHTSPPPGDLVPSALTWPWQLCHLPVRSYTRVSANVSHA